MHISLQTYTDSCGFGRYSIARLFLQLHTIGDQESNNLPVQWRSRPRLHLNTNL